MAPQEDEQFAYQANLSTQPMERPLQHLQDAVGQAEGALPSVACATMLQVPMVYYVCQPISSFVWSPCQAEQPGAQLSAVGGALLLDEAQWSIPRSVAGNDGACPDSCQQWAPLHKTSGALNLMSKHTSTDEASVVESTCSTAPSMQQQPYRKQRPRPAQRQAAAQRQRQAVDQAQRILQSKEAYACQLQAGGKANSSAIKDLCVPVWHLSLDEDGCRLVQLAIERARGPERAQLVKGLHGHVREAMGSLHANHVIQKVVAAMPVEVACFIADELLGIAVEVCRHRYGCRILCRLIEQFGSSACVSRLVEEIMGEICSLAQHTFGRFVVQAVLEHGLAGHQRCIIEGLSNDILSHATNRRGSYVVECALRNCSEVDASILASRILAEDVLELVQNQYGIFVVRALMDLHGSIASCVACQVSSAPPSVKENKNYQRLVELRRADLLDNDDDEDDLGNDGEESEDNEESS